MFKSDEMNDQIRLRHLKAFQAVMAAGSVSAAAEKLNLTQPAISKQLSILEASLDLKLFHRKSGTSTFPTKEGIAFYKAIEGTLAGLERMDSISREIAIGSKARLRIAATPPIMNSTLLTTAIRSFRKGHPDVQLSLESRHRLDIEEWIISRQVDVAIALLPVDNPMIEVTPLIETHAIAVVSSDHWLAVQDNIDLSQLANQDLILPSRQPLRTRIDQILQSGSNSLTPVIEASSAVTCCQLAASGNGIAICDPFSASGLSGGRVVALSLWPKIPLSYGILHSRSHDRNPLLAELIAVLRKSL